MKVVLPIFGAISFSMFLAFVGTALKSKTVHSAVGRAIGNKIGNKAIGKCNCGAGNRPWNQHAYYCRVRVKAEQHR